MKTVDLQQGSPEWIAHRRTTRNASDAPAMMGASPYVTRADLVRQYATGIEREIDAATQRVFDRGHEVEPALRALAEDTIGEDLYPVTGVTDDGYMGASFDGATMAEETILEAKQPNAEKQACIARGDIPPADLWQLVHQFAVCDSARELLYLVGDGTEEGTDVLRIPRERIADLIPKLIAGWRQFDADVETYRANPPAEIATPAPARRMDALPSLRVTATGMVTESNLSAWAAAARTTLAGINRELRTDDDFAEAEMNVKGCAAAEERCDAAKQAILDQTATVADTLRELDALREDFRRARLDLDKLVKARKETVKAEIVNAGRTAVLAHYEATNATLGEHAIAIPSSVQSDLAAAIKGLRTMSSLQNAVDTAVASMKIAASQRADQVRACVAAFEAEVGTFGVLFPDRVQLCATKAPEDLRNLMNARIGEHQREQQAKLDAERERGRREEQERAEREREAAEQAAIAPKPDAPAPIPAAAAVAGTAPAVATGGASMASRSSAGARIKLGQINDAIAPLSITETGLSSLGFVSVGTDRAAKLYAASDLQRILQTLATRLAAAANAKQAA